MRQRYLEFFVGIFIVLAVLAFAFLSFKVSGLADFATQNTYTVTAYFTNVGDLKARAPVTIAGVTVGRVRSITLDPKTFQAIATLDIDKKDNNIPTDSTANIYTAGIIGSNYISLTPGFDETVLKNGDKITNTNQALILQDLIGQFMYNISHKEQSTNSSTANKNSASNNNSVKK